MTLVVGWIGIDSRWPTSAYIASDSRIYFSDKIGHYDYARKVFAFENSPDILGYCGDVLFPSMILSQIVDMGNSGLLFNEKHTSKDKFEIIKKHIFETFKKYPTEVNAMLSSFEIVYISRETSNNKIFNCFALSWNHLSKKWGFPKYKIPTESDILFCIGSGKNDFHKKYQESYQKSPNKQTSRNVFHCFCDTLFTTKDKYCGGAPQLVGIYSKPESAAKKFGIIKDRKRYFLGAEIDRLTNFDNIEWRNDNFELCDGNNLKRKLKAAVQPNNLKQY